MADWIDIQKDPKHIAKEKAKAKELKASPWWRNILGKGLCHYCGRKFKPAELTMDHILPVSRGGKSVKSNVVPSCKGCNQDKKYLTPAEILLDSLKGGS